MGHHPADLRARTFHLEGSEFLVLSFRVERPAAMAVLTRAEADVARELVAGASNREIARARGRSVNTIAKQIASIYRKLGVCSRLELGRALSELPLP